MNLDQLRIFMEVSELGSFQKVAQAHYVSQRAVSRQMKRLEDELNVKLFTRGKNQVTLTTAGGFFKERCQVILRMINDTNQAVQHFDERSRHRLTIGYFSPFDTLLLRDLIFELDANIDVFIAEAGPEHVITDVLMNDLDCAVVMDHYGFDQEFSKMGLKTALLHTDQMVIGASERLPIKDAVSIEQLRRYPIIYYSNEESSYLKRAFLESLGLNSQALNVERVFSFEHMQMLVSLGKALAFYPHELIKAYDRTSRHIRYWPIKDASDQRFTFNLVYRSDNHNPALRQLLDQIKITDGMPKQA